MADSSRSLFKFATQEERTHTKYSKSDARSRSPIFLVLRDDLSVLRVFVVESFFGAGIGGGTTYA